MEGGKWQGTEGHVLPLLIQPLTPPTSMAVPENSGFRPYSKAAGLTWTTAGHDLDKCTILLPIVVWGMESTLFGEGLGHSTQDLWGQLMRNALCLSPIVFWKSRAKGSVFWFCPQMPFLTSFQTPSPVGVVPGVPQ